ncbi:putative chemotaxis CheV [marine gamma proteobacterium HTCC2143]|jgi:two-component system chemotaxis response regulator CheV|uniref:Putative chemotaxis CheV n=1 Tax=marine gamma proteobacterium HTCC2143 TaxID=247633 RepID=A0YG88_9GAMM|nr:putative chemotaxis CheV [marine gamma proteobacterium HTCC2143]
MTLICKVKEVQRCPELTTLPHSLPVISGVAHIRGETTTIIDMGLAKGQQQRRDIDDSFVIITEYNGTTQGFLVNSVDRIINKNGKTFVRRPRVLAPIIT